MRKERIIIAAIMIVMLIIVSACEKSREHPNDIITIRGNVANSPFKKISLKYNDELLFSVIDSTGDFEFDVDSKSPLYLRLQLGKLGLPLYSEPGNVDSISCDEGFNKALVFEGNNSSINKYLLSKIHQYDKVNSELAEYYHLEANAYSIKMDSVFTHFQKVLNELVQKENNISEKFIVLENAQLLYKWASLKLSYPNGHKYFSKIEHVELPGSYNDYLQKLNLNDSALLAAPEYLSLLHSYLNNKLQKKRSNEITPTNSLGVAKLKMIPVLFTNQQVQDRLLIDVLRKVFTQNQRENIPELVSLHNSLCKSDVNKAEANNLFNSWKGLTKGNPAPQFSYTDMHGNNVSLKDYIGQYVCLDIWATWCSPCKREFPIIKEMVKKFEDENIVFISISVDEDKKLWKKAVDIYDLEGIQLFASNGWQSSIITNYNINSIPRFILIDTESNIVNVNAEYPSRGLSKQIEELLK